MFPRETYVARRDGLMSQFDGGLLLFLGNTDSPMNYTDNPYHFRQDSTFLYYFGLDQADLAAVVDVDAGSTTIFGDELSLDQRLLLALGLDPRFAGIAADWIDADQDPGFPDGAEDSIYTGLVPPYRAANQIISSPSELAALEGMDKATLDVLLPHITALPGRTAINVNTATGPVLQSLDENLSVADVEGLLAQRQDTGFGDVTATFTPLVTPDVLNQLAETSDYFRLRVVVRVDTVRVTFYSLIERSPQGDTTPILRSLGTT